MSIFEISLLALIAVNWIAAMLRERRMSARINHLEELLSGKPLVAIVDMTEAMKNLTNVISRSDQQQ
jgi:hypothetical protein